LTRSYSHAVHHTPASSHRQIRCASTQYRASCKTGDDRYGRFVNGGQFGERVHCFLFARSFCAEAAQQTECSACSLCPRMWNHPRDRRDCSRNPSNNRCDPSCNASNASCHTPQRAESAPEELIRVFGS
jgi:hypothetical protein